MDSPVISQIAYLFILWSRRELDA